MLDPDPASKVVRDGLLNPGFRDALLTNLDGMPVPIVTAERSEQCSVLLNRVINAGGRANVVVALQSGGFLVGMRVEPDYGDGGDIDDVLADCTVGVFMARLLEVDDDAQTFRIVIDDTAVSSTGKVLAGVGG